MTRRGGKRLIVAVFALSIFLFGYDRFFWILWSGCTDLEIEFVISDVDTGTAIPGAQIVIDSREDTRDCQHFKLVTDADGIARTVCSNRECGGAESGLGFTNRLDVLLPYWRYHAEADGYEPSASAEFRYLQNRIEVERTGPRKSKLQVLLLLGKNKA